MTDKCSCKFCLYQPFSNQVLNLIELAGDLQVCFTTEESSISDFGLLPDGLAQLSQALGFPVSNKDFVWEVAQRLQARHK